MAWKPVLCNRNQYVAALTQEDSAGLPTGDPAFLVGEAAWTGTKTISLTLTQDEFTRLFSALLTGADINYQDEAHEVVWLLWGAIEYP